MMNTSQTDRIHNIEQGPVTILTWKAFLGSMPTWFVGLSRGCLAAGQCNSTD